MITNLDRIFIFIVLSNHLCNLAGMRKSLAGWLPARFFYNVIMINKILNGAQRLAIPPLVLPVASFYCLINKRHNLVYFRMEVSESFCLLADEDLCLSQADG